MNWLLTIGRFSPGIVLATITLAGNCFQRTIVHRITWRVLNVRIAVITSEEVPSYWVTMSAEKKTPRKVVLRAFQQSAPLSLSLSLSLFFSLFNYLPVKPRILKLFHFTWANIYIFTTLGIEVYKLGIRIKLIFADKKTILTKDKARYSY